MPYFVKIALLGNFLKLQVLVVLTHVSNVILVNTHKKMSLRRAQAVLLELTKGFQQSLHVVDNVNVIQYRIRVLQQDLYLMALEIMEEIGIVGGYFQRRQLPKSKLIFLLSMC